MRLPGTPDSIARGMACGAAVSFTPFIGFHLLFSFALAWLMRGSLFASAIGTLVGNPFTAVFIWATIYRVGAWILPMETNTAHLKKFAAMVVKHPEDLMHTLPVLFKPVLLPMLVGCIPIGIAVWFGTYWITRGVIAEYRLLKSARAAHKRQQNKQRNRAPDDSTPA
jgi:hypothetical protein